MGADAGDVRQAVGRGPPPIKEGRGSKVTVNAERQRGVLDEDAEADDAGGEARSGAPDDPETAIPYPQPPQALRQLMVRSNTHRTLPNPLPCSVFRRASCGSIPATGESTGSRRCR